VKVIEAGIGYQLVRGLGRTAKGYLMPSFPQFVSDRQGLCEKAQII
jgi:hypothetical protein